MVGLGTDSAAYSVRPLREVGVINDTVAEVDIAVVIHLKRRSTDRGLEARGREVEQPVHSVRVNMSRPEPIAVGEPSDEMKLMP